MALDLRDCAFVGPALPEPFVRFQLEAELSKRKLLPKATGDEGRALGERWDALRRKLRALGEQGGDRRVAAHILDPLVERLGYASVQREDDVITREGAEDGGWLFTAADGRVLRAWAVALGTDLDAPARRGRAYRFSPSRVAERVLLARNERVGLLTDGEELRLLLCDPARPDSHIAIRLDRSGGWRASRAVPDSYRLLLALAGPDGVAALPDLTDAARLAQSAVTRKLRLQARRAIEGFLQEVLDNPANAAARDALLAQPDLPARLWREGLILVYRLLFVYKLESSADPARAFSFAATSLWRNTYSPNTALAPLVRRILDEGAHTGGFLEQGLRSLWRLFSQGLSSSELEVKPLGGMLFGAGATPLLDRLEWGELAVARLLDALLWTPREGRGERERVHYGALDVEDLGRVYEALLELEPGISAEPMCRLRRAKLEVVVPLAQGEAYRSSPAGAAADDDDGDDHHDDDDAADDDADGDEGDAGEDPPRRATTRGATKGAAKTTTKTVVQFIEEIPAGRFFLRVGLGRKVTGSYYTPHPFVRFLVQETLGPQLAERSPKDDPQPARILALKVLDPAMGSGHFLVEACRYLGDALYEACRLCDELSLQAAEQAATAPEAERPALAARADELRRRVEHLPDPDDELVAYLPSRVPEGEESGLSQKKAEALCRRLVAVHCLYGVDKNPLAVELAKLSLWLESYAEGLPLTFMDHRLVCGDSLTGPFFRHLLTYPKSGNPLDDLYSNRLEARLNEVRTQALAHVKDLEVSVGKDEADIVLKRAAKQKLDEALSPLKLLAAAWSGGVMLGDACDDGAYQALAEAVARGEAGTDVIEASDTLRKMTALGREGVPYDLAFSEAFHSVGGPAGGFDAVVGNPPWDAIQFKSKEFLAAFDLAILNAPTKRERTEVEERLLEDAATASSFNEQQEAFERRKRINDRLFEYQKVIVDGDLAGRQLDEFRVFMERNAQVTAVNGFTGVLVPSAFHANAGATGIRKLYLEKMALRCCFSFENRNRLFDIHRSFKFAAVVAKKDPSGTAKFECGFYWHELERLFDGSGRLSYDLGFVERTGSAYLSLIELRTATDVTIARHCFGYASFENVTRDLGLVFGREIDTTMHADFYSASSTTETGSDCRLTVPEVLSSGRLVLREGKSFRQFDDLWGRPPRYMVPLDGPVRQRNDWLTSTRFYRIAYRRIAGPGDENVSIWCILPPASLSTDTSPLEVKPAQRMTSSALQVLAAMNSLPVDWVLQLRVRAHIDKFMLFRTPLPDLTPAIRLLAHSALRLSCNHAGYLALWRDQVGDAWREPKPAHTWPVLAGDDERWGVRAAIDAVVADAYGLDRGQYAHVLSTFSHKSYPKAPERCLAAFDELRSIGLDAFTKRHDPYWDIPLNENLPKPVIDLPLPAEALDDGEPGQGQLFDGGEPGSVAESARSPKKKLRGARPRKGTHD